VEIHLEQRVEKDWEDDSPTEIVLEDWTTVEDDVVVGNDGVRSKAPTLVLGYPRRHAKPIGWRFISITKGR